MPDLRFPKAHRILKRREIRLVYDRGTPYRNAGFHLFVRPREEEGPTRIAITPTRALGKAVTRNRVRRWIREVFRLNHPRLRPNLDLVVNIHRRMAAAPRHEFDRLLLDIFRKAKVLGD